MTVVNTLTIYIYVEYVGILTLHCYSIVGTGGVNHALSAKPPTQSQAVSDLCCSYCSDVLLLYVLYCPLYSLLSALL